MAYPIKSVTFTMEKARRHQVVPVNTKLGRYDVTSCNSGETYVVSLAHGRCEYVSALPHGEQVSQGTPA